MVFDVRRRRARGSYWVALPVEDAVDAVVYCRISRDFAGGAGVRRQEAECCTLATLRRLEVVEVLVDNDSSAYSGAPRPAYQRLMQAIDSGTIGAVMAWHPDRLHRSLRDLEDFITAIERSGVEVLTVTAGDIDLTTPVGRMLARQLGALARYESEHRSERVRSALRQSAQQGRWSGRRPYGYDHVRDAAGTAIRDGRLEVVPAEARVIREAAARVLAGETIYGICKDLTARGVESPLGDK